MDEIILKGSPVEIGKQHGTILRNQIHTVLGMYIGLWNIPAEEISQEVKGFKRAIRDYLPHLAEEIRGVAEGSGLHEDFIYAINARTELFRNVSLLECTAVALSSTVTTNNCVILAQNWDWVNYFRAVTQVVEVRPNNKPRMKMIIEPGMVGKIGFNEAGVGVCLNFLKADKINEAGVPVHVILRAILESQSYQMASELISTIPRAASANYLIADARNNFGSVETDPEHVHIFKNERFVVHTNSFNSLGEYCPRQALFGNMIDTQLQKDRVDISDLKSYFRLFGVEAPCVLSGGIETVHTIIMNLNASTIQISAGASSNKFTSYKL